ncbi:MAG: hypothetical protein V3G42_00670 [Oscillospiraceae bacterium]
MKYQNAPEIQKFLQDALHETKNSGEVCDLPTFQEFWEEHYSAKKEPFSERAFLEDTEIMLSHHQLDYYQELTSYRSGLSFIVRPIKKIIRKLNAFLFLPLVYAQNNTNLMTAKLFLHLRNYVGEDYQGRRFTEQRTRELELKLDTQQQIIQELSEEVRMLKERLDNYEGGQE